MWGSFATRWCAGVGLSVFWGALTTGRIGLAVGACSGAGVGVSVFVGASGFVAGSVLAGSGFAVVASVFVGAGTGRAGVVPVRFGITGFGLTTGAPPELSADCVACLAGVACFVPCWLEPAGY